LGTKGQHATPRPPKPFDQLYRVKNKIAPLLKKINLKFYAPSYTKTLNF